ncbi:anti-sigma factor family protein [Iamia sp.]|uniref:anti-sigma factor family protein n=1 Tax=Iamia sp. TaxID=2722710 RepID=UPI002BA12D28|nr:zf-HC2 domain-containing protein [Iamia sp.]HXH56576.1 zf-HC2 domain-containing protein [Iamia sp.]
MSRFAMFPKSRRMMSCRRVGEILQAYLDGEVDDLTTRRIAHHLGDCRRCGMELDFYTEIKAALARGGRDIDERALDRLRSYAQVLATESEAGSDPHEETPGA